MFNGLVYGFLGPGSSSGQGHCAVFFSFSQDTLLQQRLSPPRCINGTGKYNGEEWPYNRLVSHPGGSRNTPSHFALQTSISSSLMDLMARMQTSPLPLLVADVAVLWTFLGGYKGYGLAMMVEVFCGILAGAAVGPDIRKWMAGDREANLVSMAFNCSGLALSFISSLANCVINPCHTCYLVVEFYQQQGVSPIHYLHNTIIHRFYPQKICIGIVLDFPWDIFMSQEKLQTIVMQNFGRLKRCIMGFGQVENSIKGKSSVLSHNRCYGLWPLLECFMIEK